MQGRLPTLRNQKAPRSAQARRTMVYSTPSLPLGAPRQLGLFRYDLAVSPEGGQVREDMGRTSARIVMDQEGNTISCEIPDMDPVFDDFVYLATFRKELAQFLDTFALATTVCDDDMS